MLTAFFRPGIVIFLGVVYIFGCVVFVFLAPKICKSILNGTSVVGTMLGGMAAALGGAAMATANPSSLIGKVGQSVASSLGGSLPDMGGILGGGALGGKGAPAPKDPGLPATNTSSASSPQGAPPEAVMATAGSTEAPKVKGSLSGLAQQLAGGLVPGLAGSPVSTGTLAAMGVGADGVLGQAGAVISGVAKHFGAPSPIQPGKTKSVHPTHPQIAGKSSGGNHPHASTAHTRTRETKK